MVALPSASAYSVVTLQGRGRCARCGRLPRDRVRSWRIRMPSHPWTRDCTRSSVRRAPAIADALVEELQQIEPIRDEGPPRRWRLGDGDYAVFEGACAQLGMASPGGGAAAASAPAPLPAAPGEQHAVCEVVGRSCLIRRARGAAHRQRRTHRTANAHPWYLHTSLPSCALRVPRESGAERCGHASSATRHPRRCRPPPSVVSRQEHSARPRVTCPAAPSGWERSRRIAQRGFKYQARSQSKLRPDVQHRRGRGADASERAVQERKGGARRLLRPKRRQIRACQRAETRAYGQRGDAPERAQQGRQ